jgi:RHS repeat-associated protein
MNADNHAAYLSSTTDYTYDPADRLAKAVKTGNGAGTETYVHDDNANVISQTVKGTTATYDYDRNRLLTATASGTPASYTYDPFGRLESVTSDGKVIERSVYDGFDHVVESQKMDDTGAMKSTTYVFDPLDRTASKTVDGKTTDFAYLGLSSEVLDEKVSGSLTKSYQYSPWGERLSQIKHNGDGTTEDGYYGYNGHTDVETLTGADGDTKATYGYTAYGSDDESEFTGIDKPDVTDPTKELYNPYRYNSKRWDAQSGTYDMGFRDYNPGLNRFTTRDMYNGALADMSLGVDPYSGNRYAFTGGNPTSRVEYDGHMICSEPGVCGSDPYLTQYYENQASRSEDSKTDDAPVPIRNPEIKAGVVVVGPVGGLKQAEKWVLPRIISLFKTDPVKIHWGSIFDRPDGLTDSQWDTAVDNCQATYGLRESQCRDLPVYVVDGNRTPKIAINDASAIAAGKPFLLHRNGGGKEISDNRKFAGCTTWWKSLGAGSCDEYPFASTREGGLGSQVMGVPAAEQQIQGTTISAFYSTNRVKNGDPFLVAVINVRQVNGIYVAP